MIGFVFMLTLRQLLGRRRTLLLLAFALLPVLAAVIFRINDPDVERDHWTARVLLNGLIITTLLPLGALVFGTSALGGEIEDGTAVYLLSKPIPRWQIVLGKLLAAWLATAALVLSATIAAGLVAQWGHGGSQIVTAFAAATVLGGLVYTCLFVLLSVVTSRALITGLIYVFFWESVVTGLFSGTRVLSVRQYTLGVADLLAGTTARTFEARLGGSEALLLMAIVGVVATFLAVRRLEGFELGETG